MSSYLGKHADYYDIFYAEKNYQEEVDFVVGCIQQYGQSSGKRMLELACGTGEHAQKFATHGFQVLATDYSKDMLAHASKKFSGQNPQFDLQDMRELSAELGSFDCVVSLFDSIGYVQTNEAIDTVMTGVKRVLVPSGLFIFEFWHAAAMLSGFDSVRVRRWDLDGRELLRISETKLDIDKHLAHVRYTIFEEQPDGQYGHLEETQSNRYFSKPEMNRILGQNGFQPLAWFDGFRDETRITNETWHIVVVAQAKG
jgi:ubiquinone/menaquinone biosynthesis C-methylase UbiE